MTCSPGREHLGLEKPPGAFLYLLRWMMTWQRTPRNEKAPGAFLYQLRWMTTWKKPPGAFLYLSRWMVTWQVDLAENTWGWKSPRGFSLPVEVDDDLASSPCKFTWQRTPGAGKAPRGFSLPVEVDDDLAENTWE
ncbi:hypothetical protein ColLi_13430 [Colletotrichum liriopes]|uniref:Uncharacterized protein n=1 Tax=Colletotrichum liriopes TaxID=708192 RepID=A0AA37H0Q8_9PEZI|nr:hypothetical protein ColLi_13430 [Colletotrichum liriopes]